MKICIITCAYSPYFKGGSAIYAEKISKHLAKRGHEIVVITTRPNFDFNLEPVYEERDKIKIYWLYPLNVSSFYDIAKKSKFSQAVWRLIDVWNPHTYLLVKKILKKENPDIVHIHTNAGLSSAVFSASKSMGVPIVRTLHGFYLICPRMTLFKANGQVCENPRLVCRIYQELNRKIVENTDVVISPSIFFLNKHKAILSENSKKILLPNGIEIFGHNQNIQKENKECIDVLYAGVLTKHKGVHILIDAFKKIKRDRVRLHIVGDGNYRYKLEDMSGEDDRIIFYNTLPNEELQKLYKKMDVLVIPSLCYENFPVVIQECFRAGVPVIGSRIGGIPELIKNGYNGFLFEAGNVDDLKQKLEMAISNPERLLELGENAQDYVRRYDLEKHLDKLEQIFTQLNKKSSR